MTTWKALNKISEFKFNKLKINKKVLKNFIYIMNNFKIIKIKL